MIAIILGILISVLTALIFIGSGLGALYVGIFLGLLVSSADNVSGDLSNLAGGVIAFFLFIGVIFILISIFSIGQAVMGITAIGALGKAKNAGDEKGIEL